MKIAIVGNSPSLLEHEWGKEIDNHDIIVRFNNFVIDGFEKQLGKKYTHIFVAMTCVEDQGKKIYSNVNKLLTIPKENRIIRVNSSVKLGDIMDNKLKWSDVSILDVKIEREMNKKIKNRGYSTGIIAVQMFSDKYPDSTIDVYGINFFRDKKTHSYDNYIATWEEPKKEEEYFNKFLKNKVNLHI